MSPISPNEDQGFYNALQGEDNLGVVIRAHIYIEQEINRILDMALSHPETLTSMEVELDYSQKVHLLVALGLRPHLLTPLKALGKLRNDFAHQLETELTVEREKNLYQTLDGFDKECVQGAFKMTQKKMAANLKVGEFRHLKPPDKFILIAVALRAALLTEKQKWEQNPGESP